jgi:hypothetical protein
MTTISQSLTARISRGLANLSASCPAVAENRKKGRMKSPVPMVTRIWPLAPA